MMEAKGMFLNDSAFIHSLVTTSYILVTHIYAFTRIYSLPAVIHLLSQLLFYQLIILLLRQGCHSINETSLPPSHKFCFKKKRELVIFQGYTPVWCNLLYWRSTLCWSSCSKMLYWLWCGISDMYNKQLSDKISKRLFKIRPYFRLCLCIICNNR